MLYINVRKWLNALVRNLSIIGKKTLLHLEPGIKWLRRSYFVPGDIIGAARSRRSMYTPKGPNRGLADILYFRVIDIFNSNFKSMFTLMLCIAHVLGVIAFWEMTPQILLEVDPTLFLQPEIVQILKKVILHQGCQPLDVLDGSICTCTENPVHNQIAEDFQQRSLGVTEEARARARSHALAIALVTAIMGIMLNGLAFSNISTD